MPKPASSSRIRLVISDVDGTLVNTAKDLLPATITAAKKLSDAGVLFTIVSARPPAGLRRQISTLGITTPVGGYNGGMIVKPDAMDQPLRNVTLPDAPLPNVLESLRTRQLSIWVDCAETWYVIDPNGPHVAHETHTLGYGPTVIPSFDPVLHGVNKIVGVSDDFPAVAQAEKDGDKLFGPGVLGRRSQKYYLDITHPDANKGTFVTALSKLLNIPPDEIAVIGDGPNDTAMFAEAGLAIAMGNAEASVKSAAHHVTGTNDADGWAQAIETIVLPRCK
jgi:Cof subfamily protein (haloacid dehalogenase superfamily)